MRYDFIIIGGGIIGISTAWQLKRRYPHKKLLLIEKERELAFHQSGHNSGVIHAGVYYQPGSLKADFCRQGVEKTISFCRDNHVPYNQCGKLLVATSNIEHDRMDALFERCRENDIDVEWISKDKLSEMEPNISGTGAIHVKNTGIVDYRQVSHRMAECFREAGGEILLGSEVSEIQEDDIKIIVRTGRTGYTTGFLVTCAGLMADRLAAMQGLKPGFQIIPFRGEYYQLPHEKKDLISHLIYPIPDPELPFLGIHLTRMIDGSITVGPNAVLGWKREGYGKLNINLRDSLEMLGYGGFWKVVQRNFSSGLSEIKNSLSKRGYLELVRKYCPQLQIEDLLPYPAGIRAQAVLSNGDLIHDFLFMESDRSLHVCNAPSPAATSAIPIGNYICDKISEKIR